MIENLIGTILLTTLVFYAIVLIFDLYEARKNKNKIGSFFIRHLCYLCYFSL